MSIKKTILKQASVVYVCRRSLLSHGMDPDEIRCCHHGRSYSCLFNLREIVYLRGLRFREWRVQPKKPIRTIYLQRKFKRYSLVKAGYYNEPSSMSMMTSSYNYHFISRPSVSQALDPGRSLGATTNSSTDISLPIKVFSLN